MRRINERECGRFSLPQHYSQWHDLLLNFLWSTRWRQDCVPTSFWLIKHNGFQPIISIGALLNSLLNVVIINLRLKYALMFRVKLHTWKNMQASISFDRNIVGGLGVGEKCWQWRTWTPTYFENTSLWHFISATKTNCSKEPLTDTPAPPYLRASLP